MLIIGLTGGIGCGKTTVTQLFQQRNVPVVDADEIAHAVVQPKQPALTAVAAAFGPQIISADGSLDRDQLRNIVFTDPTKKKILEDILHPIIFKTMYQQLEQYDAAYAASIATAADPANPTAAEIATAEAAGQAAAATTFDPTNSATYNSSTSVTIYDSLGNSHVMTKYFVKNDANSWDMYVLIDGRDVQSGVEASDPAFDPTTTTRFDVDFNSVGELTTNQPFNLSGWVPLDSEGQPTGADSPVNNLTINLTGSSQYASSFAVTSVSQDGFTTGELAGLEIDDAGLLVARYTNGQTRVQGQVVLATFANQQGLTPLGNTAWSQSYASGEPVIGAPTTGTLGSIQSGALEESNVDISEQLINLIVAQRNYQANAKTIQTEDAVTQAIINLR